MKKQLKAFNVLVSFPLTSDYRKTEMALTKVLRKEDYDSGAGMGFRDLDFVVRGRTTAYALATKAKTFFKKRKIEATVSVTPMEN